MSPRPPPKDLITSRMDKGIGFKSCSTARRRNCSTTRRRSCSTSKIFQPVQPTPNPIRDRSGRLDNMQDGRKKSRSQEIDVNSFCEELVSSERTERLVETNVIQTRSSEDRKDFNVEQTRERTGRPDNTHDVTNVTDSSQTRSAHESETFNVEGEILRKRTERSVADHDVSHESMMVNEADMDFRIPGLPHSVVKHAQSTSVRQLIQKIENHPDRHTLQQDLRQNQSLNPFSPESKQMIQDADDGTQNAVHSMFTILEYRYTLLHVHAFLAQRKRSHTMDLLSVPEYVMKKGRPHGHRYGKKPGDQEYCTANQLKKK